MEYKWYWLGGSSASKALIFSGSIYHSISCQFYNIASNSSYSIRAGPTILLTDYSPWIGPMWDQLLSRFIRPDAWPEPDIKCCRSTMDILPDIRLDCGHISTSGYWIFRASRRKPEKCCGFALISSPDIVNYKFVCQIDNPVWKQSIHGAEFGSR